jgi:integrase
MLISRHVQLTDDVLNSADIPAVGELRLWDVEFKGFLARVWPSGRKSFCVRYRLAGRTELYTIGTFVSPWTTPEARAKASGIFHQFADAHRPPRDRKSDQVMTVDQLCDRYLSEGPIMKVGKRASSWKIDAMNLSRHVRPLIGRRIVTDLKKSDIARLLTDVIDGATAGDFKTGRQGLARVRGGAGSAERVLTSMKAMLNWAIAQDLLINNPAKGLSLPKASPKERFLSDAEAARLFTALRVGVEDGCLNPQHANLIRLLLLTGARKSELMGLRWEEIDVPRNRIVLTSDRTKSGRHNGTRRIPLNGAARTLLAGLTAKDSGFVFPAAQSDQKHMTGIQKTWKRVCQEAQLGNMRLHDLRHSFASFAIANGENIVIIAGALGHASTRMTERYLHLRDDDINALSERTGQRIMSGAVRN